MTPADPVAITRHGRVRGAAQNGVARFLGVPYAAAPVGARRLRSPAAPDAWSGVRDALAPAPASLQKLGGSQTWLYDALPGTSEDCLTLNVWTPGLAGHAPVLVWFHGGATRNGHGAAAAFDGTALARRGVVVVTVSYRLGALGGLAHPALRDPDTGHCANWGMQDKIAALRWVGDNVEAFGGDPARVTIAGQSSGATNAVMIAANPALGGLFARVIAQSPPLFQSPMFAEFDDAAQYTELLASHAGVTVDRIARLDGQTLFDAEAALLASKDLMARIGRPRTAPVRDGDLVRDWPYHAAPSPLPLLVGWTRDESRFWHDLRDAHGRVLSPLPVPGDAAALHAEVAKLLRLYYPFEAAPGAGDVIAAYRAESAHARPAAPAPDDPASIDAAWNAIYTDLVFRAPILHFANRHASAGAPTFVYEFSQPLAPPGRGSPHACDVPFVFGTTGHPHLAAKLGHGPEVEALAARVGDAWAGFVHAGDPSTPAAPWPAWSVSHPSLVGLSAQASATTPARAVVPEVLPAFR